jgi:hypothetical protein
VGCLQRSGRRQMSKDVKEKFLCDLHSRFPGIKKLPKSQSLYDLGPGNGRLYIRYSKVHDGTKTFFGLRRVDLNLLEGQSSIICLLWDDQREPLLIPYADFEDVFQSVKPADDGQYKVQVYLQPEGSELYIATAGRFNIESYFGWNELSTRTTEETMRLASQLTHSQVQGLLAAIGFGKGNDIWIPAADRPRLDTGVTRSVNLHAELPACFSQIAGILSEVDVIWIRRGSSELAAMFEIEHSMPVYSGLLRFNDFHILVPTMRPRFSVVSNDTRRSLFVRQVNRPTFKASGLSDICTFLEYANVYDWWKRLIGGNADTAEPISAEDNVTF